MVTRLEQMQHQRSDSSHTTTKGNTRFSSLEGWLYLAGVIDGFSKRVLGYAMADHMKTDLVIQALRMAVKHRRPPKGLIHHSDKGSQYTSYTYQDELAAWGMKSSFTGTGRGAKSQRTV
jgi:transposase InsO family protein